MIAPPPAARLAGLAVDADAPAPGCFKRYRRPLVRDLAWLVFDGALKLPAASGTLDTVALEAEERAELLELLSEWDAGAEDGWLEPVDGGVRLGLYAERLIGAWLARSARIRLLAQNWPLRTGGITLGEADFLVQRQAALPQGSTERGKGGLQLWELACKFYLGVPGRGWLGPGLNDSLAAKLARMRSHQLQLIHQPAFRASWQGDWSARAWLIGWLLAPAQAETPPQQGRISAVWAEAGSAALACVRARADSLGIEQWWLLPKLRWLRPVYGDGPVAQVFADLKAAAGFIGGADAPRQRGTGHARPLLLAGIRRRVRRGDTGPDVEEALRLMLVPPGWSQRAAALPTSSDDPPAS